MAQAELVIPVRVLDLEPVQRVIAAMAAVCRGAERDGYDAPELAALNEAIAGVQQCLADSVREKRAAAQQAVANPPVPFRTRRGRCSQ